MKSNKPPAHLSNAMKSWWREVVETFELQHHHLLLLEATCQAYDRMTQAREAIAREGLVLSGRSHPAVVVERDSRAALMKGIHALALDVEAPAMNVRTVPKRRRQRSTIPPDAWGMMFETGRDYFNDLAEHGLDTEAAALAAAPQQRGPSTARSSCASTRGRCRGRCEYLETRDERNSRTSDEAIPRYRA